MASFEIDHNQSEQTTENQEHPPEHRPPHPPRAVAAIGGAGWTSGEYMFHPPAEQEPRPTPCARDAVKLHDLGFLGGPFEPEMAR